jgi:hypothetical protein
MSETSKIRVRMTLDSDSGEFEISMRGNKTQMTEFAWSRIEQLYDEVSKAVAADGDYCNTDEVAHFLRVEEKSR